MYTLYTNQATSNSQGLVSMLVTSTVPVENANNGTNSKLLEENYFHIQRVKQWHARGWRLNLHFHLSG